MSAARQRLEDAFSEGGREALEQDPELRALLDADPEFRALLAREAQVDDALRALPRPSMPDELEARIHRSLRSHSPRGWRAWARGQLPREHGLDFALVAALLLLALMPPAAVLWMMDQRHGEFSVLEIHPSSVGLLMPDLSAPLGMVGGGAMQRVSETPTVRLAADGSLGRKIDGLQETLRQGRLPDKASVHVEALINSVAFAPATSVKKLEPLALSSEVGPCPWSSETRLLRVQVTAQGEETPDVTIEVAFNAERVAAYRLLASPPTTPVPPAPGKLRAGETFTALFELVPKVAIALDTLPETATVRVAGGEPHAARKRLAVPVIDARLRFSAMPPAYRFAAAAAWFGLELQHDLAPKTARGAFDRILAAVSSAIGPSPKEEARAFVALVTTAAVVTAKRE